MDWGEYWRRVCAPKLRARKKELGREVPEKDIAAYVESMTGKKSKRGLVSLWFLGDREPYISQFLALCKKLDLDPLEVLRQGTQPGARSVEPLFLASEGSQRRQPQVRKKPARRTVG